MRVPISYALHHPERADVDAPALDLAAVGELSFEPPDQETFACLRLAREAGMAGGTAPCVLNAADEVAVAAFLDGRIAVHARSRRSSSGALEGCRARPGTSTTSSPSTPRPAVAAAGRAAQPSRRDRRDDTGSRSLSPSAGSCLLDHPPRGSATSSPPRRPGCGSRSFFLFFGQADLEGQTRRDRVRDRRDPARRLREDHRDEPGGGAPPEVGRPRLLPPAGLEADRRDPRRPGREHRDRVRDPLRRSRSSAEEPTSSRRHDRAPSSPAAAS